MRGFLFGYNGKEVDNEVYGDGNSYDYGFRVYNPRLGRFLSVDPLAKSFAFYTPYQYAGNKPIVAIDIDGLEDHWTHYIPQNDGTVVERVSDNEVTSFLMRTWLFLSGKGTSDIPKSGAVVTQEEADGTISVKSYVPTAIITKAGPTLIGNLYGNGDPYSLEGDYNQGNDAELPGGPDAAGASVGFDIAMVGGGQIGAVETEIGDHYYVTGKTTVGGLGYISGGPALDFTWKTEGGEGQPMSKLIPGTGQYVSVGLGISLTLSKGMDDHGNTTTVGLSIGLGTGAATGAQYTFERIGAPKTNEDTTKK